MREIRLSGSEGGGTRFSLPLSYRDAFSFSFLAVAPRQQFVQNVPQLKPSSTYAVPFVRQSLPLDFMRRLSW
jgi:hypothetical protein